MNLNWNPERLEITRYLVEKGANIGATTKNGKTALDLAIGSGNVKCQYPNFFLFIY